MPSEHLSNPGECGEADGAIEPQLISWGAQANFRPADVLEVSGHDARMNMMLCCAMAIVIYVFGFSNGLPITINVSMLFVMIILEHYEAFTTLILLLDEW